MFSPRGGLENTVFAIMDCDRSKYFVQPDRMPYYAFPGSETDPEVMATGMDKIAAPFAKLPFPTDLPLIKGMRFALNVAACDRRPVVIINGNSEERTNLKKSLGALSWSEEFAGQFAFVETDSVAGKPAIEVVQPDEYGLKTTLLASSNDVKSNSGLKDVLKKGLAKFQTWTLDHRRHLATGVRNGYRWKTVVPVEDKQADAATKRLWGDK